MPIQLTPEQLADRKQTILYDMPATASYAASVHDLFAHIEAREAAVKEALQNLMDNEAEYMYADEQGIYPHKVAETAAKLNIALD